MGQLSTLHVTQQMANPCDQTLPLCLDGFFQRDRVGQGRIGGTHRFDKCAHCKFQFCSVGSGQMLHLTGSTNHVIRHHLIALAHKIKDRMLPLLAGEASILGVHLIASCRGQRLQHLTPGIKRVLVGGKGVGGVNDRTIEQLRKLFGVDKGRELR